MRKLKKGRKFSRESSQRKALMKLLASALFVREKIKTTEAKAKETARFSEKLITKSKMGSLASKRYLLRFLTPEITKKLIDEISPRYKTRPGGYTRVIKLGPRKSDGARMAIIELVK